MRRRRRASRRGMLLLVILGLLAMFGLVAVAFVVLTGQALRSAKAIQRIGQLDQRPEETLHEAAMQALRGPAADTSVLFSHSLLEDMYGNETVRAQILALQPVAGGQLVEFTYQLLPPMPPADPTPARRVGCVVTMVTGNAAGQSTRIVGVNPTNGNPQMLAFERGVSAVNDTFVINGTPFSGTGVGYNAYNPATGLLDAGMGEDLNHNGMLDPGEDVNNNAQLDLLSAEDLNGNGVLDAGEDRNLNGWLDPVEYALVANPLVWYRDAASPGGANEDYDAVDYQNMLLAAQIETPQGLVTIPSLHRPELMRHWIGRVDPTVDLSNLALWTAVMAGTFTDTPPGGLSYLQYLRLKRAILLRPLPEDHFHDANGNGLLDPGEQFFTGSNPAYRPGSAPYQTGFNPLWNYEQPDTTIPPDNVPDYTWDWDVDNDGDGQADGIWVDLGLPVRTAPDGRLYKPLVSFLCVDLDGRLNLNAHGCLAQTIDEYYQAISPPYLIPGQPTQGCFAGGTAGLAYSLPRGQGYGPADINLRPLFASVPDYSTLLTGDTSRGLAGRYAESAVGPGPGISAVANPLMGDDPLSQNKSYEYFNECWRNLDAGLPAGAYGYWGFLAGGVYRPNAYGSPPDFIPDGAVALDLRGQPLCPNVGRPNYGPAVDLYTEYTDDPYELNLSQRAAHGAVSASQIDSPYTPAELERLLRPYDVDATKLSKRLHDIAPGLAVQRHKITTESWDVPCPSVALTREMREEFATAWPAYPRPATAPDGRLRHPAELLLVKMELELRRSGAVTVNPGAPVGDPTHPVSAANTVRQLWLANARLLLPLEMLRGLKMDVNRPFGNGLDDTAAGSLGYNVVDEPAKVVRVTDATVPRGFRFEVDPVFSGEIHRTGMSADREKVPQVNQGNVAVATVEFDHVGGIDVNGDGFPDPALPPTHPMNLAGVMADRAMARQLYARHLYVLAMMVMNPDVGTPPPPTTPLEARRNLARALAQWAVNVVDFRDRDSIMTPFEFDYEPFTDENPNNNIGGVVSTWDVDGVIDPDPNDPASDDNEQTHPYRGLVWGCERPELLITETLAFHDRRTEDTDLDPTHEQTGDPAVDPNVDDDFDQIWSPEGSLLVEVYNPWTKLQPKPADVYNTYQTTVDDDQGIRLDAATTDFNATATSSSPVWRLVVADGADVDTDGHPKDPDDPIDPATPEQAVYFVRQLAGYQVPNDGAITRSRGVNQIAALAPIKPGRYGVIGPGDPTDAGMSTTYVGFADTRNPGNPGNSRRIELQPLPDAEQAQVRVFSDPDAANPNDLANVTIQPAVAIVINEPRRLSISEPPGGYPAGSYTSDPTVAIDPPADLAANPMWNSARVRLKDNGTFPKVKMVHLQRLANPLLPWSVANPYRTIDSMPVDLTSFNGVTNDRDDRPSSVVQEQGNDGDMIAHERGDNNGGLNERNLWRQEPTDDSLGKLNRTAHGTTVVHYFGLPIHHTLGYLNDPFGDPRGDLPYYRGDPPTQPGIPVFPWLTWNNRPFVSQLEMLLAPTLASSQLLKGYSLASPANPYDDSNAQGTFVHLLNYFRSAPVQGSIPPREFHRLLDLLGVPSRFVGTEVQGDPLVFGAAYVLADPTTHHQFRPPFNLISRYREPGRVNLNTVFSQEVWKGLMNLFPDSQTQLNPATPGWKWPEFLAARRGYNAANPLDIDLNFPTRFAGVFRSSTTGGMVPLANLKPTREVNASVLRENPNPPQAGQALFEYDSSTQPVTHTAANSQRNPYFRYEALQRLGNLVTNRSNVYAMWITVGYFEVEPAPRRMLDSTGQLVVDPSVYPDGYALGQELGSETGEIKRHRAFYLIDRSIPVGFARGQDLNTEKAILLKRFIE